MIDDRVVATLAFEIELTLQFTEGGDVGICHCGTALRHPGFSAREAVIISTKEECQKYQRRQIKHLMVHGLKLYPPSTGASSPLLAAILGEG